MNDILINKAIRFASIKHKDQKRKGTDIPYIMHPMEVFGFLAQCGCDDKTLIGGILHDVLEDTETEREELAEIFGEEIAELVASESEDKTKTWQERKQATIDNLKYAPLAVKHICCADKLSNLVNIYLDKQECGEKVWERFSASKERIKWYYESVTNTLDLADFPLYLKLKEYYAKVFSE